MTSRLVLASSSKNRLGLLQQIGIKPDAIIPADIDESQKDGELPRELAHRLAVKKAKSIDEEGYVLAADTVISVGRRVLPKPMDRSEAKASLNLLSGRSHRAFTGVAVKGEDGKIASRLVQTRVIFKRLSLCEIEYYLDSQEWQGRAGAYAIQGLAGAFIVKLSGSYSSVVGLPIYETLNLLGGLGWGREPFADG